MKLESDVSASFDVLYASANGSYFHVHATQVGRTTLKSTLDGIQVDTCVCAHVFPLHITVAEVLIVRGAIAFLHIF